MSKLNDLKAKRLVAATEARRILTDAGVAGMSAEQETSWNAAMAEVDKIKVQIDQEERLEAAERELGARMPTGARGNMEGGGDVDPHKARIDHAFTNYLLHGLDGMSTDDRNILQQRFTATDAKGNPIRNAAGVTTGVGGGFTVPEGFEASLVEAQKAFGGMLTSGATILDTDSGNPLPMPMDNDTYNTAYIVGENVQQPDGPDVAFSQLVLGAYQYTTRPIKVSYQYLQDSFLDINSWLPNRLQVRLMRRLNTDLTIGDGIGKPTGILTAAQLGAVGATGETVSITYNDFINLQHSVDPAYRKTAKLMFHDTTLKIMRKIVDTQNRPLWELGTNGAGNGVAGGVPDTFAGMPYMINQDMPVPAAGAKTIIYGDFSAYMIRRVKGAIALRLTERYADAFQVGFILGQRWDANLADAGTHPIVYFQQSAT